jgi:polyphosphate glucokinase
MHTRYRGGAADLASGLSPRPNLADVLRVQVLVIDIGGSHIKLALAGREERARFDSSPDLTPTELVRKIACELDEWRYDVVSIGYPGRVAGKGPTHEPGNLGNGWVSFDFEEAFDKPVRIVNDAVMQALGAFEDGRMLFLGLGTGVGSALVTEHVAVPLELGELPYPPGKLSDSLGRQAFEERGLERWQQVIADVVPALRCAFAADYVVLGGGLAAQVGSLPPRTRGGGNEDAVQGGERLWRETIEPHDHKPSSFWRVVP